MGKIIHHRLVAWTLKLRLNRVSCKTFRHLLLAKRMDASYVNKYGNFMMDPKHGTGLWD